MQGRLVLDPDLPVLHTFGDAYSRGRQHGEALRDQIHACFREVWSDGWFRVSPLFPPSLFRRWAAMQARFLNPDERDELRGVADGSGLPLDEVQVMNAAPPFEVVHNLLSGGSSDACTQIASRRPRGALVGRNLDAIDVGGVHRFAILAVHHPSRGLAWASPGFVGKVLDAVTGWNEAGLVVAQNVSELAFERFYGLYTGALVRRVVAECATVGEAARLLGAAPRLCGGGRSLLVARGDDAVVLEVAQRVFGPSRVHRRSWGECGDAPDTLALTNHYRTPELVSATPGPSSWARLARAMRLAREGIDSVEAMMAAMTDTCRPSDAGVRVPGNPVSLANVGAEARGPSARGAQAPSADTICCCGPAIRRFGPLPLPRDLDVRVATRMSTVCDLRRRHLWVAVGRPRVTDAAQYRCFDVTDLLKESRIPGFRG